MRPVRIARRRLARSPSVRNAERARRAVRPLTRVASSRTHVPRSRPHRAGARLEEAHRPAALLPGEFAHRVVDLLRDAARGEVLGRDDRHDPLEPELAQDQVAAGDGGLGRIAAAPLAPDDVVADLRHELALDRLEHRAAVAEERAVGRPLDRPEPEAVAFIAVPSPGDPALGLGARLRRRIVLHRNRVAENLEERVDVVERELPERQALGVGNERGDGCRHPVSLAAVGVGARVDSRTARDCHLGGGRSRDRGVQSRAMAIYLDHAATTPLRREALDAMLPFLTEQFGNPSSAHAFGRKARAALDEAHERVATRLHAEPREIIFTSGGTEANNLAIKGAAWAGKARGHRIVTSPVEHHAVGHTLKYLERFGFEVVEVRRRPLRADRSGRARRGDHRQDDPRLGHAREQRGRHGPADRRDRPAGARPQGRPARTSTPSRARRTSISTSRRSASTCSRSRPTSSRARRASAPCTSATARTSSPSSRAASRSGTAGPARRTSPGPSGLAAAYDLSCEERPETVKRLRRQRDRLKKAVLAVEGAELTGHPKERLPGLLSIIARDTDGASVDAVARSRGDRLFGRLGLHDGLDRGRRTSCRRWATRTRRRAARCGCRSAGRRPTPRSTRPARSCRGSSPRCGWDPRRSPPIRSARAWACEPDPRRDVGGRRLVRRRGARPRAGPRRRRRLDAPPRRRRHRTRSSRRAAARSTRRTTRGGSPASSGSRST